MFLDVHAADRVAEDAVDDGHAPAPARPRRLLPGQDPAEELEARVVEGLADVRRRRGDIARGQPGLPGRRAASAAPWPRTRGRTRAARRRSSSTRSMPCGRAQASQSKPGISTGHPAQRDRVVRLVHVAAVRRRPECLRELGFERDDTAARRRGGVRPASVKMRLEIRAVLVARIAVAAARRAGSSPGRAAECRPATGARRARRAGPDRRRPTRRTARRWSSPRASPPRAPDPASCGSPRCASAPARAAGRRATRSSLRRSCSCRGRRSAAASIQGGDSASPRPTR